MQQGGGSVFSYGAVSRYGVSTIGFLPNKKVNNKQVTCTGQTMLQWVVEILNPAWQAWSESAEGCMPIVHDNARTSTTKANLKLRSQLGMEFLEWPSNSPDMNVIEWVWMRIKVKLNDKQKYPYLASNLDELQERVTSEWNSIPRTVLQNFIESMPNRIDDLIDARGRHTKW